MTFRVTDDIIAAYETVRAEVEGQRTWPLSAERRNDIARAYTAMSAHDPRLAPIEDDALEAAVRGWFDVSGPFIVSQDQRENMSRAIAAWRRAAGVSVVERSPVVEYVYRPQAKLTFDGEWSGDLWFGTMSGAIAWVYSRQEWRDAVEIRITSQPVVNKI